ncbi:MAG: hypothetical protein ACJ72S_04300 [Nitrososphaeraceae archaeon]
MMKAKCGHAEDKRYSDAHHGLCRKCHSNFAFLLELEQKYGEDALIEYWYAKILTSPSERKVGEVEVDCFIDHLIEFYQQNLIKFPSKEKYIRKMLYMLHSLQKPFHIETLR